jgi:hypothetical protein
MVKGQNEGMLLHVLQMHCNTLCKSVSIYRKTSCNNLIRRGATKNSEKNAFLKLVAEVQPSGF